MPARGAALHEHDVKTAGRKRQRRTRMRMRQLGGQLAASAVAVFFATILQPNVLSAQVQSPPPGAATDPNINVQMRGPVHEAFAQPNVFDASPSDLVPQQPPEAVNEVPPDEMPSGGEVRWIPGYWSWDPDQQRYLWISGIWRTIPAGLEWVPGYWIQSGAGYQWVSGFWRRADVVDVSYLPQPPDTLEEGPSGDPPSPDYVWFPGIWVYNTQYAWRPGFWGQCHPGWIWVPATYVWTPSGYVFVDGYWDYELSRRGVLFAPIVFANRFALGPGYAFSPSVVWDTTLLTDYLFCRPRWHRYCFGDYYDARFLNAGVYPWFAFHLSHFGYDPLYAYYSWDHRNEAGWHERLIADYRDRREHVNARPPLTFAALQARPGFKPLAVPFHAWAGRPGGALRFERINNVRREEFRRDVRDERGIRDKRLELERRKQPGRVGPAEPARRITIPKMPRRPGPRPEHPLVREHQPPAGPHRPAEIKRPVPRERVIRPHPAERLANPKFVPHPANKPRPQPEPRHK
jgi:hypothetical protein